MAMTQLLRTCLARSAKESAAQVAPVAQLADTVKLKKHISLVLERLSKGGQLAAPWDKCLAGNVFYLVVAMCCVLWISYGCINRCQGSNILFKTKESLSKHHWAAAYSVISGVIYLRGYVYYSRKVGTSNNNLNVDKPRVHMMNLPSAYSTNKGIFDLD